MASKLWSWKAKASQWTLLVAAALMPLVPWFATAAASTFIDFRPIVVAMASMQQQVVAVASSEH